MKYDIDESVRVEAQDGPFGGSRYYHPSYGMISVCRVNGDTNLFGSDLNHHHFITINISEADVQQDLGQSWYFASKRITEVELSAVQYAELISNPNTQGVPCTISYRQDKGNIKYRPPTDEINNVKKEMQESFEGVSKKQKETIEKIQEIFKKQSVGKKDREEILGMISSLSTEISSSIPFYQKQAEKILDKRVMSAKTEVESYVAHVQNKIGKHILENPELLRITQQED